MTKVKFYYGAASGSSRKALRKLEEPNVMINYATQNNKPWPGIESLFVDSGGFSFLMSKKEYTTTNEDYLKYIDEHRPEVFALRDYPCEPECLKKHDRTVELHQQMTLNKHIELMDILDEFDFESKPMAVIQGYKLQDYLEYVDRMKDHDLILDYIGVGSVCRRQQDYRIRRIILEVKKELPSRCKLHAFGVKSNVLRFHDVREALHSADSMAYHYGIHYQDNVSGTNARSFRDSALSYLMFKRKINQLIKDDRGNQRTLEEYALM